MDGNPVSANFRTCNKIVQQERVKIDLRDLQSTFSMSFEVADYHYTIDAALSQYH